LSTGYKPYYAALALVLLYYGIDAIHDDKELSGGPEHRRGHSVSVNWMSDKIGVSYLMSPLGVRRGPRLLQENVNVLD
jgi:hypothetical protein